MPRRSATTSPLHESTAEKPRLKPPATLDDAERELFSKIVAACNPEHFTVSDTPLIISFVQATLMARDAIQTASGDKEALLRWERAVKLQAVFSIETALMPAIAGRSQNARAQHAGAVHAATLGASRS